MPVLRRFSGFAVAMMGLSLQATAADNAVVARIGERAVSLDELDAAGGQAVHEAREQLYEARVRALYQLLSNELFEREATSRGIKTEQLIEQEITSQVASVTDEDLDTFLKSQAANAPTDARGRKQAQVYLGLKRQADAKRDYVSELFGKYQVHIALAAPPPPPAEEVRGATEPVLGNNDAPVTIIAFSDYRCPYCKDLSHTLDQLLERYPKDVRVVYRHFPLHEDSEALAHAALCAADQEQFAAYHQQAFAKNVGTKDVLSIAKSLDLNLDDFHACMKEQRHHERIAMDTKEAQRLNISGTPTLFVAGQRIRGAQSLQRLSASVQEALRTPKLAATKSIGSR